MKTLTISTISLIIAGFTFGEEPTQKGFVIDKTPSKQEILDHKQEQPGLDRPGPKKPHRKPFPHHWGRPPVIQTKDIRPLPAGFGMGSSTLARWIVEHLKKDKSQPEKIVRPKRPEPSEEVKTKIAALRLVKTEFETAKKALFVSLKGKSRETATDLIKVFKESQKDKHEELKRAHKDLLKEVRKKKQTGDRRE